MNIGSKLHQEIKEANSKTQAVPSFLLVPQTNKNLDKQSYLFSSKNRNQNPQVTQSKNKANTSQEIDEVWEEYKTALKEIVEMKEKQNQSGILFLKLEEFTQNVKFQRHEKIKQELGYVKYWIEYAGYVQDTDKIYDYMIDHDIGKLNLNLYISVALFYEKYQRNFEKAEKMYLKSLEIFTSESQRNSVLNKFKEFSERMEKRCDRDVKSNLNQEEFKVITNSKKRKREEAFPELNDSSNSGNSNSSKKRRLNFDQQVEKCSKSIKDYNDGILYLKTNKPDFQEIEVHENLVKEQFSKPLSWLGRVKSQNELEIRPSEVQSEQQSSIFGTLRKELENQFQVSNYPKDQEESKVDTYNNCQNRPQNLEPIGEISAEIGSSIANLTIYQKDILGEYNQRDLKEQQVKQKELQRQESLESKGFITANNSNNESAIVMNRTIQSNPTQQQKEISKGKQQLIMNKLIETVNKHKNSDKDNNRSEIYQTFQEVYDLLQQIYGSSDSHNIQAQQELQQLTQQTFTNLPTLTQPVFSTQCQQEIRASLKPEPVESKPKYREEHKSQKRFSGILMELIENDEKENNNLQESGYHHIPPSFLQSQGNHGNIRKSCPQPMQPPVKDWMNMDFFPTANNGPQNRNSTNSNYINMSGSFLDATPLNDKFQKNVNPDYSRDLFQKKKIFSKNKDAYDQQDDKEIFQSPFGPVSPLPNQESKARNSNIMRDYNSEFINVLTKGNIVNQPLSNQPNYPQNQQQQNYNYQTTSQQQQNNNWYNNLQQNNGYTKQQPQYQGNQNYYSNNRNDYQNQQNSYSNQYNMFAQTPANQHQYNTLKPSQPNQALNFNHIQSNPNNYRDSFDSAGQEFKDCNSNENVGYGTLRDFITGNNQQPRENSRGIPSALKSQNEDSNRTGSKSVRFK